MLHLKDILLLGDPRLRQVCDPVEQNDLEEVKNAVANMHQILLEFREKYQAGRAIAAPQIGYMKRLVYQYIDTPIVYINPEISFPDNTQFELWDDCMSFPNLLVKVRRYNRSVIEFRDLDWHLQKITLEQDLSELLQHEVDHLDGILAIDRAIDRDSFRWRAGG